MYVCRTTRGLGSASGQESLRPGTDGGRCLSAKGNGQKISAGRTRFPRTVISGKITIGRPTATSIFLIGKLKNIRVKMGNGKRSLDTRS